MLVDTCVWSLALRRQPPTETAATTELAHLIEEGRAVMIGLIRQEILSGVRSAPQLELLRQHLRAFPDLPTEVADHEEAAAVFNRCRAQGIQGSAVDCLICAVTMRWQIPIFTIDGDFARYARVLPLGLHGPRG